MNPQFAEVSRILGQSESDRQFVLFSNLLKQHVPGVNLNSEFASASRLWERRNNTWVTQLQQSLKGRNPPVYNGYCESQQFLQCHDPPNQPAEGGSEPIITIEED